MIYFSKIYSKNYRFRKASKIIEDVHANHFLRENVQKPMIFIQSFVKLKWFFKAARADFTEIS